MKLVLKNDFHGTEISMSVKGNYLTRRQLDKIYAGLCGNKSCACGDYAGVRGRQRYILDYQMTKDWTITGAIIIDTQTGYLPFEK